MAHAQAKSPQQARNQTLAPQAQQPHTQQEEERRTTMNHEIWRQIPGWEGYYEVSNLGHVRSMDRIVSTSRGNRFYKGKILNSGTNRHGYPLVALSMPGKPCQSKKIHRLVLLAFCGPCPDGMEACHNNGNRADARLENLRWDTPSNNHLDKRRHGTDHQVNKKHCPQGHPYSAENTKVIPSRPTARYCRECHRERSKNRWNTINNKEKTNV